MSREGGTLERAVRFAFWADSLRRLPTAEQVMTRFEVSRATAYRLIRVYQDAKGVA